MVGRIINVVEDIVIIAIIIRIIIIAIIDVDIGTATAAATAATDQIIFVVLVWCVRTMTCL